jgi:hypothetical protein
MADQEQGNIRQEYNNATTGLNLDQSLNQIPKGKLSYALNAAVENFDANSVNYQNESGNELCVSFPEGYVLIGTYFINEESKHIFFITSPNTGDSQIGYMYNNDCQYQVLVNSPCLNFNVHHPIHKCVHKISNCTTEIYWTDGFNPRRYLDINDIPKILRSGSPLCSPIYTDDVDCNQLKLQPNFSIPQLNITDITNGGNLLAGTYQFAVQYSDAAGNPYTSYYSITNPTPIADIHITSVNFNYPVGKSIIFNVSNLDLTGQFQYFNIAVIKTINAITSVELIGTYFINQTDRQITYTGQNQENIRLSINDIFEKTPYYDIAQDVTAVQDILVWDNLTSIDRINYQQIASQITLQWETWKIPATENYSDELNATNLRSYLRDEVYAFEIVFLLRNGKQTDGFHIPGRVISLLETSFPNVPNTNPDFIGDGTSAPYWKIYNTASVDATYSTYSTNPSYKGPYQYGEFAYWESTEEYPCNIDVWGDLAGQKIRHHKFPDVLVSPIIESKLFITTDSMVMGNDAVFPIGVKINNQQILSLINSSNLTVDQKSDIIGFKIVRGDRGTNKSIVAKGILRNVGKYTREKRDVYFPNYPYNDLNQDPFLSGTNNAYAQICKNYDVEIYTLDPITLISTVQYTDCNTDTITEITYDSIGIKDTICSTSKPTILGGTGRSGVSTYEIWEAQQNCQLCRGYRIGYYDRFLGWTELWINGSPFGGQVTVIQVVPDTGGVSYIQGPGDPNIDYIRTVIGGTCDGAQELLPIKDVPDLAYRQIFNSPETSFGQPFLGTILKLENVMFGAGKAHFIKVKNNAKYRLLTKEAQQDALKSSSDLAAMTTDFNSIAMFTAYQAYLSIYINGITRKNYAYSFNSIADYNYNLGIPNNQGVKQRNIDLKQYLIPGVISTGDNFNINNWHRETSVYLRTDITNTALPFPDQSPEMISTGTSLLTDKSRFTISEIGNCTTPEKEMKINVVSYYAALKNLFVNQWGQIYSYDTIDTGFQQTFDNLNSSTIFGGDTFISRFAFKTKLPFFIDNRVNALDDSDIFYDEIGNVAYPKYWHSARSILANFTFPVYDNGNIETPAGMTNIISYKAHNFDCPNSQGGPTDTNAAGRTYYDGYFYLFAYGIPNFYCESAYNTDLRQAFNNREGDFFPHVSTTIPDDWFQETFVPIIQDNTYYYNITFSKQNKENTFTHLPPDWEDKLCYTHYPFRAIYSDTQNTDADNRVNAWLTYRAISYYDFPQNFGKLTSLDGIQNRAILARFENKSLLYNTLLTIDTSNPQAAYMGNPTLFRGSPPVDFAETDLGYVGSQNKMLLKIPQGQITIDAKRGQVFLVSGQQANDLSAFGSGMNRFFTDHLAFEILRFFPTVNTDNNFTGVGLHGLYDSKFDRVIITKLDYVPIDPNVKYDPITEEFYIETIYPILSYSCELAGNVIELDPCFIAGEVVINGTTTTSTTSTTTTRLPETEIDYIVRTVVSLKDRDYFCNKSWTLSFNMNTKSWISFHSYIPNWYIAENNFFYSGLNSCCEDFDFIAGTIIPNPPTTTTTTTTGVPPTTTTTTTSTSTTSTTTTSTTSTTTTSTTTMYVCQRPLGLTEYQFIIGYNTISPVTTFVSTANAEDACVAAAFIINEPVDNVIPASIYIDTTSISINSQVYLVNGTTDCTCVPDGWYFTPEMAYDGQVLEVSSCYIVNIVDCIPTTTTTTTSTTTTTTTTIPLPIPCGVPTTFSGGISYPFNRTITLDATTGITLFDYDAYSVPDRFIVSWNAGVEIDTGYVGTVNFDFGGVNRSAFNFALLGRIDPITSNVYPDLITYPDDGYPRITSPGIGTVSFNKTLAAPADAYVDVYAPMNGTAWTFKLNCPGITTTTTTTTTSTTSTTTSTTSTTTSTTSSTTTTTTTTAIPVYDYLISTLTYLNSATVCALPSEPVTTIVYSSYAPSGLITHQLYTDAGLTTPYIGTDGYHWFSENPSGGQVYWVRTASGVVTTGGFC